MIALLVACAGPHRDSDGPVPVVPLATPTGWAPKPPADASWAEIERYRAELAAADPTPVVAARRRVLADDPAPILLGEVPGYADTHVHQLAALGFGGHLVWGQAEGLRDVALSECPGTGRGGHGVDEGLGAVMQLQGGFLRDLQPHHGSGGFTSQSDRRWAKWPSSSAWSHQQHHEDALHEAVVHGGLRLIVMSAVNNALLCLMHDLEHPSGCADAENVGIQLAAAWAFAERHRWYEVALTPGDANHAMARGHLAVVLSLEASNYFDARKNGGVFPDAGSIRDHLDAALATLQTKYGVSVVQAVHQWDNPVGRAAFHGRFFHEGFRMVAEGRGLGPLTRLQAIGAMLRSIWPQPPEKWPMPGEDSPATGRCTDGAGYVRNAGPPVPGTDDLVAIAQARHVLLDLAHLSERTACRVLALQPGPLFVSHAPIRSLGRRRPPDEVGEGDREYSVGDWLLGEVAARGGVVGLRTLGSAARELDEQALGFPDQVASDCRGSTGSFAQSYLYAAGLDAPVALATDFNGGAVQTTSPGDRVQCEDPDRLIVPRPTPPVATPHGPPTFDDAGVADMGTVPAMLADLARMGVVPVDLWRSGQAFVDTWLAVYAPQPPIATPTPAPPPANVAVDAPLVGTAYDEVLKDYQSALLAAGADPTQPWLGSEPDLVARYEQTYSAYAAALLGDGARIDLDPERGVVLSHRDGDTKLAAALGRLEDPVGSPLPAAANWAGALNRDGSMDLDGHPETAQ